MMEAEERRAFATKIAKYWIDRGMIVEGGFRSLVAMAYADAPPEQVAIMRDVFFAGAQHLFGSIMQVLDPGNEPSEADLARMDNIDKELRRFIDEFSQRNRPAGHA